MKNPFFSAFFLIYFAFTPVQAKSQTESKYFDIYPEESKQALQFYQKNILLFQAAAIQCNTTPEFLFAIVAPEVANYSTFQDVLETAVVETFYSEIGSEYANFSLGRFQIKPSFVEQLEQLAAKTSKFKFIAFFDQKDSQTIRQERLTRIKSLRWQIHYLSAFCFVMNEKCTVSFPNITKKLQFYALVYNLGFKYDAQSIKKWETFKGFPAGLTTRKLNYSKIAIEFYEAITH